MYEHLRHVSSDVAVLTFTVCAVALIAWLTAAQVAGAVTLRVQIVGHISTEGILVAVVQMSLTLIHRHCEYNTLIELQNISLWLLHHSLQL